MNMPAQAWNDTGGNFSLLPKAVTGTGERPVLLVTATSTYSVKSDDNAVRDKFSQLALQWKMETGHMSKLYYRFMNINYMRIVAMGNSVIPVILNEMKNSPDHWYWALKVISHEDPVAPEHIGRVDLMCKDWIEWGLKRGYLAS